MLKQRSYTFKCKNLLLRAWRCGNLENIFPGTEQNSAFVFWNLWQSLCNMV